jgi:hypothetical protein
MPGRSKLDDAKGTSTGSNKEIKSVFVIMPFTRTPTRTMSELQEFYKAHLKRPIEKGSFTNAYNVSRSDSTFNITDQIYKELFGADILIADLSGIDANPNVMYELGIRLALSNKPVILIREKHPKNNPIFDVSGYHTLEYPPENPKAVSAYLVSKIKDLEEGKEHFESPVYKALGAAFPSEANMTRRLAIERLRDMHSSLLYVWFLFCKSIEHFAAPKVKIEFSGDFYEMDNELLRRRDELSKLKWGKFFFLPQPQPAIHRFLKEYYLHGLLESNDEDRFNRYVMGYLETFFSTDEAWNPATYESILMFSNASAILTRAIDGVVALLNETRFEVRQAIRQQVFEHTGFITMLRYLGYWNVEDSVHGVVVLDSKKHLL